MQEPNTSIGGVERPRPRLWRVPSFGTLRYALIGWWVLMFFGTHWPDMSQFEPDIEWLIPNPDRFVHCGMYMVWAFLWWLIFLVRRGSVSRTVIAWVFVGGAAWAAFDECTQAIVGRTPDIADFACDMGGVLTGLIIFRLCLRRLKDSQGTLV